MKFPSPVSTTWIANLINAEVVGSTALDAFGINEIHKVEEGDIVFVDHPKYYSKCLQSKASHIIINSKDVDNPLGKILLFVEHPFDAYLKIARHFAPFIPSQKNISDTATIGANTIVMPGAYIGHHVRIGDNCIIHANAAVLDYSIIGNNVIINPAAVIGSDAFYYNTSKQRELWYRKMESCGNVVIEDDVEIGAGCTIDRGVTATTRIGRGTKIDNAVHIGHDCNIGSNCLLAAQVGIAGATTLEDGVTLWGQVGVSKTLTIGKNAVVLAQSGVPSSIEGNKTYFGTPVEEASVKRRELVWVKRIPEIWKKIMGEESI